jgi:hypothetical protein
MLYRPQLARALHALVLSVSFFSFCTLYKEINKRFQFHRRMV